MKKGWTYKKLGEVAAFMSGYTPDKSELFSQGKYPYFKVAEMNNPGNELFMRYTSFFIDSPKKVFPKGSIIFPKNGGAIYTEKKRILEYDSVIDLNSEAIFPNEQIVLKYLFCFLNHIKISSFDKGGGLPSLDLKKMANCLIPLPALSEQNKIVKRLDAAFAQIDELKANAEKQLAEARALFQKSLAKAMEPKKGWEEKKVKDLSLLITKGSSPKWQGNSYVDSDGILFVTSENVREGNLVLNPAKYVDKSFNQKQRRSILKKDDVLVNIVGASIGRAAIFDIDVEDANINQAVCLVRLDKQRLSPHYLCLFLNSEHAFNQYAAMVKDTARANLSLENIGSLIINIPPLSEQQRIVERLDSISEKVRKYEEIQRKIIAECDALKQALLRQVFE